MTTTLIASKDQLPESGLPEIGLPETAARDHRCSNCGATLAGAFCHACGQSAHVHRSVVHVLEEVFHGITHFDSRAWRSIPMLIFRPGKMTHNYIMGHRARYIPPFAMFLASVFAMFLAFAIVGGPGIVNEATVSRAEALTEARQMVAEARQDIAADKAEIAQLEAEVARLKADPDPTPGELAGTEGELAGARATLAANERRLVTAQTAVQNALTRTDNQVDRATALREIEAEKANARRAGDEASLLALGAAEAVVRDAPEPANSGQTQPRQTVMDQIKEAMRKGNLVSTPWPEWNHKINKKLKNPDLFLYKLQNTAYKFSFLLVPISLPFIWIMLFWKRGVTMFDHCVFALYSLSFMSFAFVIASILAQWVSWGVLTEWLLGLAFVHLFFHLKGTYKLGWMGAFWRVIVFGAIFAPIAVGLFLAAIVLLGVSG